MEKLVQKVSTYFYLIVGSPIRPHTFIPRNLLDAVLGNYDVCRTRFDIF